MQFNRIILLAYIFICKGLFSQEVISPGLFGSDLFNYLNANHEPSQTLGYNNARDIMYSIIDIEDNNQLVGVYSGYTITLDINEDPSTNAYEQGINCEHPWPQSLGSENEPMKSDIHHLFPTKSNVNSSRGNDPFEEINDVMTDKWYRNDYYIETIPTEFINEYAEKYNPPNPNDESFEPREIQKGNTARAMFYFYTIYTDEADISFWEIQKQTLIDWHYDDLPDMDEIERTNQISSYQGNNNPYVIDPSLVGRVFIVSEGSLSGDANGDESVDVIDVVVIITHIIGDEILSNSAEIVGDVNYDSNLDILDVIVLVQLIIN